jgi:hypothetical protein
LVLQNNSQEFAEVLRERKPASVKEVMIRSKGKKQEKRVHKVAYEGQKVTLKMVEVTVLMEIEKEKVIYKYCGKPNHIARVCRKKTVGIKIALRENLVKKRRCFKCGKQEHITRMCNEKKITVLSEENKNTSTYSVWF